MVRRRGMTVIEEFAERIGMTPRAVERSGLHLRQMSADAFAVLANRKSKSGATAAAIRRRVEMAGNQSWKAGEYLRQSGNVTGAVTEGKNVTAKGAR